MEETKSNFEYEEKISLDPFYTINSPSGYRTPAET